MQVYKIFQPFFFFSSRRRHTIWPRDWSSDVCSSDLPYGMTECLAVAAIDLDGIEAAGQGDGVCVGSPVPRVRIAIAEIGRASCRERERICEDTGLLSR